MDGIMQLMLVKKIKEDTMCIKVLDKKVLSSNGKNMLSGKVYLPDGDIKGYFHVVHGMTEHIARYDSFMSLMAEQGYLVCKLIRAIKGSHHISPLVENLAFGAYNDHFKSENDPKAWLTKDIDIRKKYIADKYCTFKFTVSAMHDLISLNKNCNTDEWFSSVAKKMPILLTSGEDDPVGDYGKGIRICEEKLKTNGASVVTKLYPNNRHEILNDSCREEAIKDILDFIA